MCIGGLHFKIPDFIVQFISSGTTKAKLAILAFLYCAEFVKTPLYIYIIVQKIHTILKAIANLLYKRCHWLSVDTELVGHCS